MGCCFCKAKESEKEEGCCCKAKESEKKEGCCCKAKESEKEEGCCCYCMRRSCCKPCETMGYKTEDKFAEKMSKATKEKLKTAHKVRSFRLGSSRAGVCINGLYGVLCYPFCFLACANKRQCTVVSDERRIVETAAQENHGIDLRKRGENRVGRKRYVLLGALCRLCITAACCYLGDLVNECAISQLERCFECAANAPLEGTEGDAANTVCRGAKPLAALATGKLVEEGVRVAVKERKKCKKGGTEQGVQAAVEERSDNKAEIEELAPLEAKAKASD